MSCYYSYTMPQAFREWFGRPISQYEKLRGKISSLERNGVLPLSSIKIVQRSTRMIRDDHLPLLHNLVLLLALFPDPAQVKRIVTTVEERQHHAAIARKVLIGQSSLLGEVQLSAEVQLFLDALVSWDEFVTKKLPDPFVELPHFIFKDNVSLLEACLAKGARKDLLDQMLMAFLKRDVDLAYSIAVDNCFESPDAKLLSDYIIKMYRNAQELENYLDEII